VLSLKLNSEGVTELMQTVRIVIMRIISRLSKKQVNQKILTRKKLMT